MIVMIIKNMMMNIKLDELKTNPIDLIFIIKNAY